MLVLSISYHETLNVFSTPFAFAKKDILKIKSKQKMILKA